MPAKLTTPRLCNADGCSRPNQARGLCSMHYQRAKKCGLPPRPTLIGRFILGLASPLPDACLHWKKARMPNGYGVFFVEGPLDRWLAHRYAWTLCYGPIPEGMQVLHRCDRRDCVNPWHLFLGTQADNMADMHAKKRGTYGERVHNAKLTPELVRAIREMYAMGDISYEALGRQFGVSGSVIHDVIRRITWKHIA